MLKVISNHLEFFKKIEPLFYEDLEDLGFFGTSAAGFFDPHRLPELIEFCKSNPRYHIISILEGGVEFNKLIDTNAIFMLGKGDNDPELAYIEQIDWEAYECLQVLKFNVNQS